jgi:uncharacterized membrane protein YphA (DoxX/SURF4 family)
MTQGQGRNAGGWASGRPGSPGATSRAPRTAADPAETEPPPAEPHTGLRARLDLAGALTADWAPTVARVVLGVVLLWFGYHELVLPGEWTGYVPVVSESSSLAIIAVLAHGWVLLVLAAALIAGIVPRVSAALASVLLMEIVISLAVTGLSDTALRDLGVLGLALCLTGSTNQRLVLRT